MSARTRAFDLFLLAPLGIAVVAYQLAEPAEIVPPVALVLCVIARALQDVTGWVIGKRPVAFAVLLAVLYVIIDIMRNSFEVELFADFMMILAALKAMERRTPRDDGQLLVVSVFVALAAAVSSNRMGTGVLLVLYLFSLMFAVMRMQVDASVWPKQPTRRGRLWPLLGACIVGTSIVASFAFVLLPRNTMRWSPSQFTAMTQSVSGFRESVELGTGGLISQDPSVVMRIWPEAIDGEPGEPIPAGRPVYLRGIVLTEYERSERRGRWSRGDRRTLTRIEPFDVLPGTSVPVSSTRRASQTSVLRVVQYTGASSEGTVFSLWRPNFVTFEEGQGDLRVDTRDFSLRFDEPPGTTIEYRVRYVPDIEPRLTGERGTPPNRSGSDVLFDTARRVLEDAGIEPDPQRRPIDLDLAAIRAIEGWLRSSKSYTLDIEPAPPGRDPTEWFVEDGEAGHCEYFASALALLLREIGINSRVATGYLAIAEDDDSDFVRVRRSDAHAWVEAEIAPGAWAVFDATPAALGAQLSQSVNPFTRWLSSLESVWLASFISFDARSQSAMSRSLQESLSFGRFGSDEREPKGPSSNRWRGLVGAALLVAAAGGLIVLVRRRIGGGADGSRYDIAAEARRRRDDLDRAWKQAGTPRPRGTTLVRHAAALGGVHAEEAAHIERLAFGAVRENGT